MRSVLTVPFWRRWLRWRSPFLPGLTPPAPAMLKSEDEVGAPMFAFADEIA